MAVTCLAVGGSAALGIFEGGGYSYTSDLPKSLHNKLHSRPKSAPKPVYCALGSQGRYYVSFANGKAWFVGPEDFNDEINSTHRTIATIAFGEDWDTYFICYPDGWWKCGGNPPSGLMDKIRVRNSAADLEAVSLGGEGEWYLKAKNGRSWWGNTGHIDMSGGFHNRIRNMHFGDDGAFVIRHDP